MPPNLAYRSILQTLPATLAALAFIISPCLAQAAAHAKTVENIEPKLEHHSPLGVSGDEPVTLQKEEAKLEGDSPGVIAPDSQARELAPLEGLDEVVPREKVKPWMSLPTAGLVKEGIQAIKGERLGEATEIFQEALKRDPHNAVALNNLAVCQKRQGQIDEAINNLTAAIEENPSKAELHNNLATAYMAKGNLDEAMKSLYDAQNLNPDYAEAHYNLAHLLVMQGNFATAVTEYQAALKSAPDRAIYHRDLGDALAALGRHDNAMIEYRAAEKAGDHTVDLRLSMAKSYKQLGEIDHAREIVEEILRKEPGQVDALNELGVLEIKMQHWREAAVAFHKAMSLDRSYPLARNNLAIVLFHLNRKRDAIAMWRRALDLKPDYQEAHYNLGTVLYEQGDYKQAKRELEECLKVASEDAFALNNLGLVEMKLKDRDAAILTWRRAIELNPDLAQAFLNLGHALSERHAARSNRMKTSD